MNISKLIQKLVGENRHTAMMIKLDLYFLIKKAYIVNTNGSAHNVYVIPIIGDIF
jgi:hypothetical protein